MGNFSPMTRMDDLSQLIGSHNLQNLLQLTFRIRQQVVHKSSMQRTISSLRYFYPIFFENEFLEISIYSPSIIMRVSLLLLVLSLIFKLAVAPEPIPFEPKEPKLPNADDPKTREPTG